VPPGAPARRVTPGDDEGGAFRRGSNAAANRRASDTGDPSLEAGNRTPSRTGSLIAARVGSSGSRAGSASRRRSTDSAGGELADNAQNVPPDTSASQVPAAKDGGVASRTGSIGRLASFGRSPSGRDITNIARVASGSAGKLLGRISSGAKAASSVVSKVTSVISRKTSSGTTVSQQAKAYDASAALAKIEARPPFPGPTYPPPLFSAGGRLAERAPRASDGRRSARASLCGAAWASRSTGTSGGTGATLQTCSRDSPAAARARSAQTSRRCCAGTSNAPRGCGRPAARCAWCWLRCRPTRRRRARRSRATSSRRCRPTPPGGGVQAQAQAQAQAQRSGRKRGSAGARV